MASPPAEDVLITGLREGDEDVFVRLVDSWSPSMLRLARSFVSTHASAEEVVQDTWLAVIQGIDRFQGRSSLRTWVYRILVNTAKNRGVREKRTIPWTSLLPAEEDHGGTVDPSRFRGPDDPYPGHWRDFPPAWPSTEAAVLAHETRAVLDALLDTLPVRQRSVIVLRDVEGHSSEEVCAMLQISAANQRVLLHRARAAVRSGLENYFASEVAQRE